jgi:hypothetical protein
MNNSINNFSLNIQDYDNNELLELLGLDYIDNTQVKKKISTLKNNNNTPQIRLFLDEIQNKLLNTDHEENLDNLNIYNDELLIETNSNNNNNIENFTNMNFNNENNNEYNNDKYLNNEYNDNRFEFSNLDNSVITNYKQHQYLHFNTEDRLYNTSSIPTNCEFLLSNPINNICEIRLGSINIRKPFLIDSSGDKINNKFCIKWYIKNFISNSSDISQQVITIPDGYYYDSNILVDYLNNEYFYDSITDNEYITDGSNNFLKSIKFSIDKNTNRVQFITDTSRFSTYKNTQNFEYFTLDFYNYYTKPYSLAHILGFDKNYSKEYKSKIIDDKNIIISPSLFNNMSNNDIFFCFDEYKSNIVETHRIFLKKNMLTNKVLGKINGSLATNFNNYNINEFYSDGERDDVIRKYTGYINLLKFKVQIIDIYGKIINTNINENFTFTLEVITDNSHLDNDKFELTKL